MQTTVSFDQDHWQAGFSAIEQTQAIDAMEEGKVLLFPKLVFTLLPEEKYLLNPAYLAPKAKNISLNNKGELAGAAGSNTDLQLLEAMLKRFAGYSQKLMYDLFPEYTGSLIQARTSFRPAAVSNRKTSYRKDDRLLHVDAFPATPNQGRRILRVFSNVNPHGEARVWHIGEPFRQVAERFVPEISKPFPGKHRLMQLLHLTKSKRSLYDHYMLNIHNRMKKDCQYQQQAIQEKLELMPDTTWVVATDQVSHAALSGQFMLEQTFYLPVSAMKYPERSPLKVLESLL